MLRALVYVFECFLFETTPGLFCFKDKGLINAEKSNQLTEPIFRAFSMKISHSYFSVKPSRSLYVSGKLPAYMYPSPRPTLTLTFH